MASAECHTLRQGSVFADTLAYTMFTRPSVYHHRQTVFSREGEGKTLPKVNDEAIFFWWQIEQSSKGAGALVLGEGIVKAL